jgi:CelD/BcsL family acetyltransferase involved in cellulose biosynthesis
MNIFEKLSYVGVVLPTSISSLVSSIAPSIGAGEPFDDAAGTGGLNVRLYRSWPSNEKLLSQWNALARAQSCGGVFQSPAWQGAIARPFNRVGRYRVCTAHVGDQLCAVLPLQVGTGGILETPGEMISDYLEPLVDPASAEHSWRSMLSILKDECATRGAPSIVLHNVPSDGSCRTTLTRIADECGFTLEDSESAMSGRIELKSTWDEYLATALDGRERKELKRKLKNATTKAGARLTINTGGPHLSEELERIFTFMESTGGAKATKARWTYRPMFRRIASELAANGLMKLYGLEIEGKPAAGLICFPTLNGPMLWAAGFDASMAKWSPGIVLFAMAIQDAIAGGAKYFDLLRGQCRYKSELGASDFALRKLTLRVK